jgi:hypothetical protein
MTAQPDDTRHQAAPAKAAPVPAPARRRPGSRRRWLVALDPIFEAGRSGARAGGWDVEDELVAVALLGDVTIDLSQTKSSPVEVSIDAYAILRDVDVIVAPGDHVELTGGAFRGHLSNEVPDVAVGARRRTIHVHGHSALGDVTIRPVATS